MRGSVRESVAGQEGEGSEQMRGRFHSLACNMELPTAAGSLECHRSQLLAILGTVVAIPAASCRYAFLIIASIFVWPINVIA